MAKKVVHQAKPAKTPIPLKVIKSYGDLWFKVVVFAFAFVLYGNTLQNGYSLDDTYVTYKNPVVQQGAKAIPHIFSSLYINMNAEEGGSLNFGYRPVAKAMFALEYSFFGDNPFPSHLINVLLYALTLVLLFVILRRLMNSFNPWFPFIITMLWAAHPIHTEVVASLKNREEILSLLCGLLTLYYFILYAGKPLIRYFILAVIFLIVSFISKPSTIMLAIGIPLALYFFTDMKLKKIVIIAGSLAFTLIAIAFILRVSLPASHRPLLYFENPLMFENNFLLKISTGFYVLLFYIKMLLYPHPLLFYYGYNMIPVVNFANVWVILSILIHLGLFGYATWKIKEKHILSFGILFYLVSISMYASIVKQHPGIVAERFLFLPSIGFSIVTAWLLFKITKQTTGPELKTSGGLKVLFLSIILLIPYTAKTIIRNRDWDSQLSLIAHDNKYLQNSAKANYIYATTLKTDLIEKTKQNGENGDNKAEEQQIIGLLNKTVQIYPGYFEAWNSLGEIYSMTTYDYDKALEYFRKSAEAKPAFAAAWFNMGYAYQQKGDLEKAITSYKQALVLDSTNIKSMANLATCFNNNGKPDSAIILYKQITHLRPRMLRPYLSIISNYYKRGDTLNAILWLEKAAAVKPKEGRVSGMLTKYFMMKGDSAKAKYYRNLLKQAEK
jgi:tetratricopeptide (TPR) repeat protein